MFEVFKNNDDWEQERELDVGVDEVDQADGGKKHKKPDAEKSKGGEKTPDSIRKKLRL